MNKKASQLILLNKGMKTKIEIIVVDDQPIFRKAMVAYLNTFDHMEVVADVTNGKELIDLLKKQLPDIIILDLKMPVMDGWQAFDIIKQRLPDTKVVVLSNTDNDEVVFDLYDKGINSFISKHDKPETIDETIREVYLNGFYMDEIRWKKREEYTLITKTKNSLFSERETQILKEVCNGSSNKKIAKKFYISTPTVNFHKQNIYRKANVNNAIGLITFATKNSLLSLD
jgi:two-component system nitrate/nitrite response regulator NarL